MTDGLTAMQRATVAALTDTVVPRLERAEDPTGFWARRGTDSGAHLFLEQTLLVNLPPEAREGLLQLVDAMGTMGLAHASPAMREVVVKTVANLSPDAAVGVATLAQLLLFFYYGAPDEAGPNPNWAQFGYAGPPPVEPPPPKRLRPMVPDGDELTLDADVVVVGSGAGGGVIAGTLATAGHKVVVLEAGGYFDAEDFNQLELWAYQNLYYRGGPHPTADGNISIQSGACLGGGTLVNWTNCLRTTPWVRAQWAQEHGLEGVDGPDYDRHLDAVLARISATDACSDLNGPHLRMKEGCEKLGYDFNLTVRNTDPARYDPDSAAHMGFGDRSGAKQGTLHTYLQDAADHGADIVVRCSAERILLEGGRATGVEATWTGDDGRTARVTVRAPQVVVAASALESPALLLRSGIGGPAVGDYLRLHPTLALVGIYADDQKAWWGPPQAGLCHEFADTGEGYGFLIEGAQYAPANVGAAIPWTSGAAHKDVVSAFARAATFIAVTRDRGHGRVTIDAAGNAVHHYAVTDELDQANLRRGLTEMARLHEAAGAESIIGLAAGLPRWSSGEDLAPFLDQLYAVPLGAGGHRLFTAHETGSCRMGADPSTSVADPWGQLHDTKGVWIGDGSAFPTPSGTNPMISIMALAHRTAETIASTISSAPSAPLAAGRP